MVSSNGKDKRVPHHLRFQSEVREGIPPPICEMSDAELLRAGMLAKYKCGERNSSQDGQREAFALQLEEARKEWARRFPRLPLAATF